MANKAHNFAYRQGRIWRDERDGERDARIRALSLGATMAEPFPTHVFRVEPGDDPAHRWIFPDGSDYVIGDSGGFIHAAHRSGGDRR